MTSRSPRVTNIDKDLDVVAVPALDCLALSRHGSLKMDYEDYNLDPFSNDELWRLSKFTLDSLQPLESLPWDENLPGTWYLSANRNLSF